MSPSRAPEVRKFRRPVPRETRSGEQPCGWRTSFTDRRICGTIGKLVKDLSHLAVSFSKPKPNTLAIEMHHGVRKNVAALRTVRTILSNLITGVTKGYLYKLRYVYAHFPINLNLEKNAETGCYDVEIRYARSFSDMRMGRRRGRWVPDCV